jgi:hypothetical protein
MIRERARAELERRAWMGRLKEEGKPIPAQPYFDRAMLAFSNAELRALAGEPQAPAPWPPEPRVVSRRTRPSP